MKTRTAFALMTCLALIVTGSVGADDDKKKEEAEKVFKSLKCPVSGKPLKKDAVADYMKAKVYFCCPNCPKAFAKNMKKFATKANHQLVATKQFVQKACPMTGGKTKDQHHTKVAGVGVKFCCPKCKGATEKMKGDEQLAKVFGEQGFKKGFEIAKKKEKKKAA